MATTEERLAALEAKLAQLTTTTPTEYYTHQYSGEEIDAAVGRAVTGGALDTSVSNVSNQLGTFVRPNLLDNWYFGNPVDQRGGKIVQYGKITYRDAACTIEAGIVSEAVMAVTKVSDTVYTYKGNDGNPYYVKAADVVRGYTGNWYGVDRWNIGADVIVTNKCVTLRATGQYSQIFQPFELQLAGKTVTMSALINAHSNHVVGLFLYDYVNQKGYSPDFVVTPTANQWMLVSTSFNVADSAPNKLNLIFYPDKSESGNQTVDILAVKLELGPTQTLAHRENGQWVLNEVPDYGEQLRRCQRYYQKFDENVTLFYGNSGSSAGAGARLFLPTAVQMRTKPVTSPFVINVLPEGTVAGTSNITFTPTDCAVVPGGVCIYGTVSPVVGIGSYTYKAIVAQLRNAPLALSADL